MTDPIELRVFHNRMKLLQAIDREELDNAGVCMTDRAWAHFRTDPWRYFIQTGDDIRAAIWSVIENREHRATVPAQQHVYRCDLCEDGSRKPPGFTNEHGCPKCGDSCLTF